MPYEYLEDIATADVCYVAWGETREAMFRSAAEAALNVMVEDLDAIEPEEHRRLDVEAESLEMLLFEFLQQLIFIKDAEMLLLRVREIAIHANGGFSLRAEAYGETLDMHKHPLNADVKAVTLHRFRVGETERGWEATVVLDI
jgi:SHS2 domain-containing protein